jgi:hypothetical protein
MRFRIDYRDDDCRSRSNISPLEMRTHEIYSKGFARFCKQYSHHGPLLILIFNSQEFQDNANIFFTYRCGFEALLDWPSSGVVNSVGCQK